MRINGDGERAGAGPGAGLASRLLRHRRRHGAGDRADRRYAAAARPSLALSASVRFHLASDLDEYVLYDSSCSFSLGSFWPVVGGQSKNLGID